MTNRLPSSQFHNRRFSVVKKEYNDPGTFIWNRATQELLVGEDLYFFLAKNSGDVFWDTVDECVARGVGQDFRILRSITGNPVLTGSTKPTKVCECGVKFTGGLHSDWCPIQGAT